MFKTWKQAKQNDLDGLHIGPPEIKRADLSGKLLNNANIKDKAENSKEPTKYPEWQTKH